MILIAGGTGRLGSSLVRRLAARDAPVRVLARHSVQTQDLPPSVDFTPGDVRDPASVSTAMRGIETVVSCIQGFAGDDVSPASVDRDGNINLIRAARAAGARVVLMSVVGASPGSRMELFRMKRAAETAVMGGANWTVVRATAFLELWIELLSRSSRPLVFGRGDSPINFVSVEDVSALLERVVSGDAASGQVLEIGGPENLTFNQLAQAVCDRPPRHIPRPMLRLMANTAGRMNRQLGRQARAALVMDTEDLSSGPGSARDLYPDLPCTSLADVLRTRPV